MKTQRHSIPGELLTHTARIQLVGAGGNGSQMLTGLARLHTALRALEHPGLAVTVCDPDIVTEANVGRQLFSPADIGQHKAVVLVHRLNAFFGLNWHADPRPFTEAKNYHDSDFIIGCVDTIAARREIAQVLKKTKRPIYWLDLGNDTNTGQVILGGNGLPTIMDYFPGMKRQRKERNTPSCSLAESLERQDLFINQAVTTWALHLLWTMFRTGGVDHVGYYVNLLSGRVTPVVIPKP